MIVILAYYAATSLVSSCASVQLIRDYKFREFKASSKKQVQISQFLLKSLPIFSQKFTNLYSCKPSLMAPIEDQAISNKRLQN
jgi:hypothetical protein